MLHKRRGAPKLAEGGGDQKASGSTPAVFISYASQDLAVANAIVEALERCGIACWIAPRDVKPGEQYADAIVGAINAATVVVLLQSQNAVASSHVGREVERAASKNKPIIAFRIDAGTLSRALEYFLSESQWIDVSAIGMPAALARLTEAVRQGPRQAVAADPVASAELLARAGRRVQLIAGAAVVITIGVAIALGLHFWSQSHKAAPPAAAVAMTDKSIAVLPFVDMSEKKDQEYFADGMAEEILDLLAKIPSLKVIGRTSSFQFKGKGEDLRVIGARLGAAFVLEGSIRKVGPRIRVTAQLIDARSGTHRWSDSYDRDFGDILTLQDEMAAGIARALQLSVDADESPRQRRLVNTEAYALYLRGLLAQDQQHLDKLFEAIRDFEQALALDPTFLRASEALARARVDQGFDEDVLSHTAWQQAREVAQRTLRIDSSSAPAHGVLGLVHGEDVFDWKNAEAEFRQALVLNPRDSVTLGYAAIIAGARGLKAESQRLFNASLAVDPLNPYVQQHLGQMLMSAGEYAEAQAAIRKSIAINRTFDGNHYYLSRMLLAHGEPEAAQKEIQPEAAEDARDAGLSMIYHALHRQEDSDAALARLTREAGETWPYSVATVYAYRGELDKAFEWLEKGIESRDSDQLEGIRGDPEFVALRKDARYKALLHRMDLTE
jgi:TolB-like protein